LRACRPRRREDALRLVSIETFAGGIEASSEAGVP
jgi:hypothetical protein